MNCRRRCRQVWGGEGKFLKLHLLSTLVVLMALCWSFVASVHGQQGIPLEDLLSRFPGYHLLTMQERDPDVQAFLHHHFPKENPSLVRADFNGDGIIDYAVLVENDKTRI